jgi:DNA-binding IclR family transcriptional regulator
MRSTAEEDPSDRRQYKCGADWEAAGMEQSEATAVQPRSVTGTQAIGRAATILRLIARKGVEGARLTYLTKAAALSHPTIHRILKCLVDERFVVQDSVTRRYRLGPLNFELGLATPREGRVERGFRTVLAELARQSGDTAYLMARSGADIVCLERAEGTFPIRSHTFDVGGRRPLGFGAAGLALLSELDDREIERVFQINMQEILNHGRLTVETLRQAVARTRSRGYAVTSDIYMFGIGSVGMVIRDGRDPPVYAVNISTVGADRFGLDRIEKLRRLIKTELDNLPSINEGLTRFDQPDD